MGERQPVQKPVLPTISSMPSQDLKASTPEDAGWRNLPQANNHALTPRNVLQLQRLYGNRAVQRIFSGRNERINAGFASILHRAGNAVIQRDEVEETLILFKGSVDNTKYENAIIWSRELLKLNKTHERDIITAIESAMFDFMHKDLSLAQWCDTVESHTGSKLERPSAEDLEGLSLVEFKSTAELLDMTLQGLNNYSQRQLNWHNSPKIDATRERPKIRALIRFARMPNILAGCGSMKADDLLDHGLINEDFTFEPLVLELMQAYCAAVRGTVETVDIQLPAGDAGLALRWGWALQTLQAGMSGSLLKKIMPQEQFAALEDSKFVDDFVSYYQTCHPNLMASDGYEVKSYLAMRGESVDPVSYDSSILKGKVRNYHRFEAKLLEALKIHYGEIDKPDEKRLPLTLILHSGDDHNGGFHRNPNMTDVVTSSKNRTLLIEGVESLDDIKGQIGPLAEHYGKDGKIDQVLFAGHGNTRTIEFGMQIKDVSATAQNDFNLDGEFLDDEDYKYLVLNVGDKITGITNVGEGWAEGTANGKSGLFPADHTDAEIRIKQMDLNQHINLDTNRERSDAVFNEVLAYMATDSTIGARQRIVFNACLTNSNTIYSELIGNPEEQQKEVRERLLDTEHDAYSPSLATYVRNKVGELGAITVLGANGSTMRMKLIDDDGVLQIVLGHDPQVTNPDKLAYVREGYDPQGVIRAVLECWAGIGADEDSESGWKKRREACFHVMSERIKLLNSYKLNEAVIKVIFELILNEPDNGELIRALEVAAFPASEFHRKAEVSLAALQRVGLYPGGRLHNYATEIFDGISSAVSAEGKLVIHEVWMKIDSAKKDSFIDQLMAFNCQTAAPYLDIDFILGGPAPKLEDLLDDPSNQQQMLLAFRVLDEHSDNAVAKNYLLSIVNKTERKFPDYLNVDDILKGNPPVEKILEWIELGASAAIDEVPRFNIDIDNDGTNDYYIQPLSQSGTIEHPAGLYSVPYDDTEMLMEKTLDVDEVVNIIGQADEFYAIESEAGLSGTAFIKKDTVKLI